MDVDAAGLLQLHGLTANNSRILQADDVSVVVRAETDRGAVVLKVKTEAERPATEYATQRLLSHAGLPVAPLIAYGQDPIAHIVCGWLEGAPLSSESSVTAQRHAGALLRQIHERGGGPPYAGNESWEEWMKGWLNHALSWWRDSGGADAAMVDAAWSGYRTLQPILSTRGGQFILFDGRPEHFLVTGDRVVGIVDLELARSGDGAMDLGVMGVSDGTLLEEVVVGYAPDQEESGALELLIPFYVFLRRLAAAEWKLTRGEESEAARILQLLRSEPVPAA